MRIKDGSVWMKKPSEWADEGGQLVIVEEIRKLYSTNEYPYWKLGKIYGLDSHSIKSIITKENWKWLS